MLSVTNPRLPEERQSASGGDKSSIPVPSTTAAAFSRGVDVEDELQAMDSPPPLRECLNVLHEVVQGTAATGVDEMGMEMELLVDSAPAVRLAAPQGDTQPLNYGGVKTTGCLEMLTTRESNCVFSTPSTAREKNRSTIDVDVTIGGAVRTERLDLQELALLYAQKQAALSSIRGEFDVLYVPDWVHLHPLLGSYVAEAFGTFVFVLTLSLVSVRNLSPLSKGDDTNMTALPIGFVFMSMVFTFGYISGGHFNPAVTLAVFLVRKIDAVRAVGYIISQTAASLGAGLVAMAIQGSSDIFVPRVDNAYVSSGVFSELIITFAIATVVLNVAYSRQSGNFFHGFAVGMTVVAGSAAVGRISGGVFNPAAATGLQLALCLAGDCDALSLFWVYWMAPLLGSVIAATLYAQIAQPEETPALGDTSILHDNQSAHGTREVY